MNQPIERDICDWCDKTIFFIMAKLELDTWISWFSRNYTCVQLFLKKCINPRAENHSDQDLVKCKEKMQRKRIH